MKNVSVSMGSITEGGGGGCCGRGGSPGLSMGSLSFQGAEAALMRKGADRRGEANAVYWH